MLSALMVLLVPHLARAAGGVRAAAPGRITVAPDGVSGMELVVFDPGLAPALLAVPPEGSVRIDDWPVAPGLRRTLVMARHDVYAPDGRERVLPVADYRTVTTAWAGSGAPRATARGP